MVGVRCAGVKACAKGKTQKAWQTYNIVSQQPESRDTAQQHEYRQQSTTNLKLHLASSRYFQHIRAQTKRQVQLGVFIEQDVIAIGVAVGEGQVAVSDDARGADRQFDAEGRSHSLL